MSMEKITPLMTIRPLERIDETRGGAIGAGSSHVPFSDLLGQAMKDVGTTQAASANDAYDLVMGNESDLHSIMIRSAMETTAVETAVELTSRVVSAYKEIMQMQI